MTELQAKLDLVYEMCDYVEKRVSINKTMTLREILRYELLKFAIYLYLDDDKIDQKETNFINNTLCYRYKKDELEKMKYTEYITEVSFGSKIPEILKHFVLTDAAFKSSDIKYHGEKAKTLVELYKIFGEEVIASGKRMSDKQINLLTKYMNDLNNFLKEYNLNQTKSTTVEQDGTPVENIEEETDSATLEELLEELNSLTGLQSVKDEINNLINLVKISKLREEKGLKTPNTSKHMVFTGNPGTGKTTIARLLSSIYKKLGVLSKGQMIECDRSALVAGYVGQTAMKTEKVVTDAIGGILFIDEAYTLSAGKGEGDFGQEAIDTLLKIMEDNRDDLVVIVAGYPDLMEEFLKSNPGLKSRFNRFINFEDYTAEELYNIMENMTEKQEYHLSDNAKVNAQKMLQRIKNETTETKTSTNPIDKDSLIKEIEEIKSDEGKTEDYIEGFSKAIDLCKNAINNAELVKGKTSIFDYLEEDKKENNGFANARTVRNMLEFAIINQATRIAESSFENESEEEMIKKLMTIESEDFIEYKLN